MKVVITQTDVPAPIPAGAVGGLVAMPGGQDAALELQARHNIVTNVASGTAVKLKNIPGNQQVILSRGAFILRVYPSDGTLIEGYALNQPATLIGGGGGTFTYDGNITWYVTSAVPTTGGVMTGPITQNPTHQFWSQNGEIINRLGGRALIGGAVAGDGAYPNVRQDWLAALNTASFNGGPGVNANGTLSQVYILTDATCGSAANALTVGAQTLNLTTVGETVYPLNIIAVNNNATLATAAWGAYLEAHRANDVVGETTGMEIEVRNSGAATVHDPYGFFQTGQVSGLQLGAGAGLSAVGQSNVGYAASIFANPMQFNAGLLFFNGSIAAAGPGGATVAIGMPVAYEMDWFSGAGVIAVRLFGDSSGALNIKAKAVVNTGVYADQAQDIATAVDGGAMTVANGVSWQIYNPSETIATFTTTMPANPVDGQDIYFSTSNAITAWALTGNTGQTVVGAPGVLLSTQSEHFRWSAAAHYWFRMSGDAYTREVVSAVQTIADDAMPNTAAALAALIATLPTTLPSTAGELWLNGGILCVS